MLHEPFALPADVLRHRSQGERTSLNDPRAASLQGQEHG